MTSGVKEQELKVFECCLGLYFQTRETLSASACGFLLLLLLWSFMNIYFSINLYIARSVIRCGYYSVYHVIKLYVMYCSMLACIFSGQGTLSN